MKSEMTIIEDQTDTSTSDCRPVDLVHLSRLTLGNRDLEQEVLQLFIRQSSIYLKRLSEASDKKSWCDVAHTIKGSAKGIGAWKVAEIAEAIERVQKAEAEGETRELLQALSESVEEANAFIESVISKS